MSSYFLLDETTALGASILEICRKMVGVNYEGNLAQLEGRTVI